jgi:Na+/glutamate symporter
MFKSLNLSLRKRRLEADKKPKKVKKVKSKSDDEENKVKKVRSKSKVNLHFFIIYLCFKIGKERKEG